MIISRRVLPLLLGCCLVTLLASSSLAAISVGTLTKEKAKEKYGITMHARKNGDAGILVWLEFKKKGWLEKLTYTELRVENSNGKHLISAGLEPKPGDRGQSKDIFIVAFSAAPEQLAQCSFFLVCYGSSEGDVGYYLKAKDFLNLTNPTPDK